MNISEGNYAVSLDTNAYYLREQIQESCLVPSKQTDLLFIGKVFNAALEFYWKYRTKIVIARST